MTEVNTKKTTKADFYSSFSQESFGTLSREMSINGKNAITQAGVCYRRLLWEHNSRRIFLPSVGFMQPVYRHDLFDKKHSSVVFLFKNMCRKMQNGCSQTVKLGNEKLQAQARCIRNHSTTSRLVGRYCNTKLRK